MAGAAPLEIRRPTDRALLRARGVQVLVVAFGAFLAVSSAAALLTQRLDGNALITAVFLLGLGVYYVGATVPRLRGLRAGLGRPVTHRLDDNGVHVRLDGPDPGAADVGSPTWLTLPWSDVARVSVTTLDPGSPLRALLPGTDVVVRFVAVDDARVVVPGPPPPLLQGRAVRLGLTPTQTRLTVTHRGAATGAAVADWLGAQRPGTPVDVGPAPAWVIPSTPDGWPGLPRVAVVGGHSRVAAQLVPRLVAPQAAAPVAVVRNEAHRAALESVGAEVRMLDLVEQGVTAHAAALLHCDAVVLASPTVTHLGAQRTVQAMARLGVHRLVVVLDPDGDPRHDPRHDTRHDVVAHLRAPDDAWPAVDWTVVRPGSGTVEETAAVVLDALADDASIGRELLVQVASYGGPMSRIAVVGGHGAVARHLLTALTAAGHTPVALVRREAYRTELEAAGAEVRLLDIEQQDAGVFAAAFAGCDAVVFAAGGGPDGNAERKRTVDLEGSLKSIAGARAAGVRRLVQVSAIGVDDPLPADTDDVWRVYVEAKRDADVALRASDLDWTIVRPGRLTDDPATGLVALGDDGTVEKGDVTRADVAAVVAAVLDADATVGRQLDLVGGDVPVADAVARL